MILHSEYELSSVVKRNGGLCNICILLASTSLANLFIPMQGDSCKFPNRQNPGRIELLKVTGNYVLVSRMLCLI